MGYDQQLFNSEMTTGNMNSITWLTGPLSSISVVIISLVGLFIVMSAIFKQAIHGLYATNKKFFDKVDEAHRAQVMDVRNPGSAQGANTFTKITGVLFSIVLNIIPNVKAITDFEADDTDVKTFFHKSLPVACLQMFIGVFIFYGYTSQFGQKFSQFGTALLDVFFLNIDPIAWANSLPTKFASVDLSTDGSSDAFDKNVNAVAKSAYNAYVGEFNDVAKEQRNDLARQIEALMVTTMGGDPSTYAANGDGYSMSVNTQMVLGEPDVDRVHGKIIEKDGVTVATFAYKWPATDFNSGTASAKVSDYWMKVTMTFTTIAEKSNSSSVQCTMAGGKLSFNGTKEATLDFGKVPSSGELALGTGANGLIGTTKCNIKLEVSNENVKLIFTPQTGSLDSSKTVIEQLQNVSYRASGTHKVTGITANGSTGSGIKFTPTTNTKISPWMWGESPKATSKSNTKESTSGDESQANEGTGGDNWDQ